MSLIKDPGFTGGESFLVFIPDSNDKESKEKPEEPRDGEVEEKVRRGRSIKR